MAGPAPWFRFKPGTCNWTGACCQHKSDLEYILRGRERGGGGGGGGYQKGVGSAVIEMPPTKGEEYVFFLFSCSVNIRGKKYPIFKYGGLGERLCFKKKFLLIDFSRDF